MGRIRIVIGAVTAATALVLGGCVGPSAAFFPVEGVSSGYVRVSGCFPTAGTIRVRVDTTLNVVPPDQVMLYTDFDDTDIWEGRLERTGSSVWEGAEDRFHPRGACGTVMIAPYCDTICQWVDSPRLFTYSVSVVS